ncbi:hypothetical protein [Pseudomonas aeruginosa]|uniref:hypothetical protein n=1 Tax=Pseudomonas aeruginosa TaxID=287 RepID=UPI000F7F2419|nr:hypothetical protein [Pseudomonas aeruginosa]RTB44114.1 hypothetical protein EJ655_08225 [Pseudomonas aeruginosa]
MKRDKKGANPPPSVYAERAYELILQGVMQCDSAEDQRLLLKSLLRQCATFSRTLGGERQFLSLLERLKEVDMETEGQLSSISLH